MDEPKPYRVGIAGGSCSGKTTLAQALKAALAPIECEVISIDRFMLQEGGPMITLSTGERHPNNNHPLSTDNQAALEAALSSNARVVLVEGLMALHLPEFREILDLSVYVDLDAPERAVRRMVRSIERRPDLDPNWIGRYYLECAIPGHEEFVEPSRRFADLVVQGNADPTRTADLLAPIVKAKTLS